MGPFDCSVPTVRLARDLFFRFPCFLTTRAPLWRLVPLALMIVTGVLWGEISFRTDLRTLSFVQAGSSTGAGIGGRLSVR